MGCKKRHNKRTFHFKRKKIIEKCVSVDYSRLKGIRIKTKYKSSKMRLESIYSTSSGCIIINSDL